MAPFHDNKLKVVSLDESGDDATYSPPRKSAKASKVPPRPKPKSKAKFTTSTTTNNMGNVLSTLCGKRKRNSGRVGHLYDEYQPHGNRSTDSGIDGYPLESNVGQSTDSSTINPPQMYPRARLANSDASTFGAASMNSYGSFFDDIADWGNQANTTVQYLGDQNRLHIGGYDVDPRMPIGYPNSPRNNAFAAQENREAFAHLPGNPFGSSDSLHPGDPNYGLGAAINFSNSNAAPFHNQSVGSKVNQPAVYRVELPASYDADQSVSYRVNQSTSYKGDHSDGARVKEEHDDDTPMRGISAYRSDSEESDFEGRASKVPKINKDGAPRKPRQPRPKLLKWTDNDWKNVALGIVWACGEVGLPIPFDQAAQVVATSCTAGALQQALLKLRDKQLAEGYQIPLLKMAWTRKNKRANSTLFNADIKTEQEAKSGKTMFPKKTPTRQEHIQVFVITLRRAYQESDRAHLPQPHTFVIRGRRPRISTTGSPLLGTNDNADKDLGGEPMNLSPIPFPNGSGNNAVELNGASNVDSALQGGVVNGVSPQTVLNHEGFPLPRSGFVTPPRPIVATTLEAPRRVRQILHPDVEAIPFTLSGMTYNHWMQSQMPLAASSYNSNSDFDNFGPELRTPSNPTAVAAETAAQLHTSQSVKGGSGAGQAAVFNYNHLGSQDVTSLDPNADMLDHSSAGQASGSVNVNYFFDTNGNPPRTPPRTAAAEDEIARRMASSNREDGAFNPQGNANYTRYFEDDLNRSEFWDMIENGEGDDVFNPGN